MKFKVYLGPMDVVNGVKIPPKCKADNCQGAICVWLSNLWCYEHALEYVVTYDENMKALEK